MPRPTTDGHKKKLGKNLNKLVKPAPASSTPSTASQQRNNGLLLLSAQKKTSGGLLATKSVAAAPLQTTSKAFEASATSTHDALLSAVSGKSDHFTTPDAWGVAASAEKQQQQLNDAVPQKEEEEEEHVEKRETNIVESSPVNETNDGPSWDEYGGRDDRDQSTQMSRLARERSLRIRAEEEDRIREQKERAAMRLRELDERQEQNRSNEPRSLWEPNTGTSSSSTQRKSLDERQEQNRFNEPKTLWEPNKSSTTTTSTQRKSPVGPRVLYEPKASIEETPGEQSPTAHSPAAGPVIHLKNYEDRDRGERGSAPRMLYDPKSGSMVEFKLEPRNSKRARKPRKEKAKPETRIDERATSKTNGTDKSSKKQSETIEIKKKVIKRHGRLPRTCGVLYERDDKGQLRSADGCDGDLGYGAHSVPGGRIMNPEEYSVYLRYQQEFVGGKTSDFSFSVFNRKSNGNEGNVALKTGFSLAEGQEEEVEPMEWVRAGDKLELVTGADDSPTLKPTAKEWAPSHAALLAAQLAARGRISSQQSFESDDSEGEEITDDDGSEVFGLGFDPTKNMDGLMQSPSHHIEDSPQLVTSVDLDALNLEPAVFSSAVKDDGATGPGLFAFGSSGTWGSKVQTTSSSDDWGVSSGAATTSKFASTFMGLSSGTNAWGNAGALPLNGDSKTGIGD